MAANLQERFVGAPFGSNASLSLRDAQGRRTNRGSAGRHRGIAPIHVLARCFPVTRRLVGAGPFDVMARRFLVREPPCSATLHRYGDTFPRSLRSQGKAASIEYVADIAELEVARDKARRAAQAPLIDVSAIWPLRANRLRGLRILFHPSLFLVASRFPIVTIWENNRPDEENGFIRCWSAESALVARPFSSIEVRCLPPGGFAFIRALSEGKVAATALEAATAAAPQCDLAANLAILLEANIVVGLRDYA